MYHIYSGQVLLQNCFLKLVFNVRLNGLLTMGFINHFLWLFFKVSEHVNGFVFVDCCLNVVWLESHGLFISNPVFFYWLVVDVFLMRGARAFARWSFMFAYFVLVSLYDWTNWRITCNNSHNRFLFRLKRIWIFDFTFFFKLVIRLKNCFKETFKYSFSTLVSHVTNLHSDSYNVIPFCGIWHYFVFVIKLDHIDLILIHTS